METKEMLEKSIVEYMGNQRNDWHQPQVGKYHASQVWGCLRKQYYGFKDPKPFPSDAKGRMRVGSLIHNFMQCYVLNGKMIGCEDEIHVPIARGIEILGKYDMIGKDEEGEYVVDFKSTSYIKDDKTEASMHHQIQMNMYLEGLNLDRGYIMEIGKTDLKAKVFEVSRNPELIEKTFDRIQKLHDCLKEDKLPEKDSQNNWECSYCQYKEQCDKH